MAVGSPDRVRRELFELVHRGVGAREFSHRASRALARAVPFDGVSVLTMDPATHLATSAFVENGLRDEEADRIAEIEYCESDLNKFGALAGSGRFAASLSETTGGDLDRSLRHRELRAPNGFGDELRAVLVSDSATWGSVTLGRGADCEPFAQAEVELMASVSGFLAEGLRRAVLLTSLWTTERDADERSAGLALLAADNSITGADPSAQIWLAELGPTGPGNRLPPVVLAVASRARSIAGGHPPDGVPARARVQTPSGVWLTVRGSILGPEDDPLTAVMLEPTRPHELAPLIADAYELTDRERRVTQLVAQGLTTEAIAERLHISPWTVQDHLKSIFEKVGVGSRGELVARIYFDHYAPRLGEDAPLTKRDPPLTLERGSADG